MRNQVTPAQARRWLHSCRWIAAYLECLDQKRPVSILRDEWVTRGWLC